MFGDVAARRDDGGAPARSAPPSGEELVFVAAGAVESEDAAARRRRAQPLAIDVSVDAHRRLLQPFERLRLFQLLRADARAGCGSFSASPRWAVSSSRSNPGSLVATSNSTPPGRAEIDRPEIVAVDHRRHLIAGVDQRLAHLELRGAVRDGEGDVMHRAGALPRPRATFGSVSMSMKSAPLPPGSTKRLMP